MFKKLFVLFALVSFGALSASAQSNEPGSSGFAGYKPFWVNGGVGFQPKSVWESALNYKKESGSPKTSTEGVPFAIGGGLNVLPYLDLGLEYVQSTQLVVSGKNGDEFSFHMGDKETYKFTSERKVKLSYSGFLFSVLGGYTYNSFRFYGGGSILAGQLKSNVSLKKKGNFFVPMPKLGVGYFIGDFFPYFNLIGQDLLGVRYYF